MSKFSYLGNNCGLISRFRYIYPGNKISEDHKMSLLETDNVIKSNPLPILTAITADYYQKSSHKVLRTNGFKKVFRFPSSHNYTREILTWWIKKDDKAAAAKDLPVIRSLDNCSVDINIESGKRLTILPKKPHVKGFKKVKNIDMWYKIDPYYILPEKKKKA